MISFYTWWPEESDLGVGMAKSLDAIVQLGFKSISYDVQPHWFVDPRGSWRRVVSACLDRSLTILPVVSYGYLPHAEAVEKITGLQVGRAVASDGSVTNNIDVSDPSNIDPLVRYIEILVDQFGEALYAEQGRIVLDFWEPSMVDWGGGRRVHLGYGPRMVEGFRTWLADRYQVSELERRWGRRIPSMAKVRPPRSGLWDTRREIVFMKVDPCWDDWCLYRSEVLASFYAELFSRLKERMDVRIAVGLSQHGVVTQHDAYHQRCIHLPTWRDVPADYFIVSDDVYCKSPSEVATCMQAELLLFKKLFGDRLAAFITPVEDGRLVQRPLSLFQLCRQNGVRLVNVYAWNEMADGANLRDHPYLWDDLEAMT